MELIKNNFYTIYLNRRKSILQGIIICTGTEWILLKYIPVDYVIDGYLLIRTKYIKKIERGENEMFHESVIRLKLTDKRDEELHLNLNQVTDVLYDLMQNHITIQFDLYDDSVSYIGKIKKINTRSIRIENINPEGKWEEENLYLLDCIRTIQFDNDYINSLTAYNKSKESTQ